MRKIVALSGIAAAAVIGVGVSVWPDGLRTEVSSSDGGPPVSLMKTGMHLHMGGDAASRLALTAMQVFRVPINKFGTDSMETSRAITDLLI